MPAGNTFNITDECLVNLLLFGGPKYTEIDNSDIINATIKYLLTSLIYKTFWFWLYLWLTDFRFFVYF